MNLKSLIEKMDQLTEAAVETPQGKIHRAEPGGYGRKDDDDAPKKAEAPRGRGRPRKDTTPDGEGGPKFSDTAKEFFGIPKKDFDTKKLPGKVSVKHKIKDESIEEDQDKKVHKGTYGTSYYGDDQGTPEPVVKRGRGRPKKDADATGYVPKYEKAKELQGFMVGNLPAGKLPGKPGKKHKLKDWIEHVEHTMLAEGSQSMARMPELEDEYSDELNEISLDPSQIALPAIKAPGAPSQPAATSSQPATGTTAPTTGTQPAAGPAAKPTMGAAVIDFKNPNDPLKLALQQAVKNKQVSVLGEEDEIEERHMTASEKSKEERLRSKFDDSSMKASMMKKYGPERGKQIYFATIRKKAMSEAQSHEKSHINESALADLLANYPHEHKAAQEGWGMDESLYEALCEFYFREGRIPRKVWHGPLNELRSCVEGCYAEDTTHPIDEDLFGAAGGALLGGAALGPLGAIGGGLLGGSMTSEDSMEEGALGSALGGVAGEVLGSRAGPTGAVLGQAAGAAAGSAIQDRMFGTESMDSALEQSLDEMFLEMEDDYMNESKLTEKWSKVEESSKGVAEAAKWRDDDKEGKTWRSPDWDDGDMSPSKIGIDRSGRDVNDSEDELTSRPGSWRGKADMAKRMTKKGVPTKSELAFQNNLKMRMRMQKKQGGLSGPKGILPEEQGVAEGGGIAGYFDDAEPLTKLPAGRKPAGPYDHDQVSSPKQGPRQPSDRQAAAAGDIADYADAVRRPTGATAVRAAASDKNTMGSILGKAKRGLSGMFKKSVKESSTRKTAGELLNDPQLDTYISFRASGFDKPIKQLELAKQQGKVKGSYDGPATSQDPYVSLYWYSVKDPMYFNEFLKALPSDKPVYYTQDPYVEKTRSKSAAEAKSATSQIGVAEDLSSDSQMESWDRELSNLLTEGLTVTTSTGQPGGNDSVSVSATDSDAQTLMQILQRAGITGGSKMGAPHSALQASDEAMPTVEPASADEVMGSLQPDDADSGDQELGFLQRMLGARGAKCDTDSAMASDDVMGEAEVEEGNAFTGALAKAKSDGIQPGETMKVDGEEYPVKEEAQDEQIADEGKLLDLFKKPQVTADRARAEFMKRKQDRDMAAQVQQGMHKWDARDSDTTAKRGANEGDEAVDNDLAEAGDTGWVKKHTKDPSGKAPHLADLGRREAEKEKQSHGDAEKPSVAEPHAAKEKTEESDSDDHCMECGGYMEEGHSCREEKLDEWANSPNDSDEQFLADINYMTKVISGGLNNIKQDQTVVPSARVKTQTEIQNTGMSMAEMLKKFENLK